jgi:HEAT repeat protein
VLIDRSPEVRLRALEALGQLASKSFPEMEKRLTDTNHLVRIEAIEAFKTIGDTRVISKVRKCLNDRSPLVRSYAADAIGTLGTQRDVRNLRERLSHERSPYARIGLLAALHSLGDQEETHQLISLCHNRNYRIRCHAANVLSTLRLNKELVAKAVRQLKALEKKEQTVAARQAFRRALDRLGKTFGA